MHRQLLRGACALLAAAGLIAGAAPAPTPTLDQLSDAPDPQHVRAAGAAVPGDPAGLDRPWQRAEDINAWIGARFEYDRERALALSESARAVPAPRVAILEPEAFFAAPRGVCVDLARFAVSTLRRIDPDAQVAYLMIEFEPVQVQGQLLRRHWMASFRRDGAWWFFADSKRPGHLAGPYDTVERFIAEYARYRERPILGYRLLPGYERQLRTKAARMPRADPG